MDIRKECVGIINQLYDLAEVPTEKRQAINDKADKYLLDQVLRLCGVSNSSYLYVVEFSDEEIKIIDQKELDEWYKSAEEFDGILGFTVRGKFLRRTNLNAIKTTTE